MWPVPWAGDSQRALSALLGLLVFPGLLVGTGCHCHQLRIAPCCCGFLQGDRGPFKIAELLIALRQFQCGGRTLVRIGAQYRQIAARCATDGAGEPLEICYCLGIVILQVSDVRRIPPRIHQPHSRHELFRPWLCCVPCVLPGLGYLLVLAVAAGTAFFEHSQNLRFGERACHHAQEFASSVFAARHRRDQGTFFLDPEYLASCASASPSGAVCESAHAVDRSWLNTAACIPRTTAAALSPNHSRRALRARRAMARASWASASLRRVARRVARCRRACASASPI